MSFESYLGIQKNHMGMSCEYQLSSVLFSAASLQVLKGVVPSHMGDMRVCVEHAVDSPKSQKVATKTGGQSTSSFR